MRNGSSYHDRAMRSEVGSVVRYRSGSTFTLAIAGVAIWSVLFVGAVRSASDLRAWPILAFLLLWLALWWQGGAAPRVELHDTFVYVVRPFRRIRVAYSEIRAVEFGTRYWSQGKTLRLDTDSGEVAVWSNDWFVAFRRPPWQRELRDELIARLNRP